MERREAARVALPAQGPVGRHGEDFSFVRGEAPEDEGGQAAPVRARGGVADHGGLRQQRLELLGRPASRKTLCMDARALSDVVGPKAAQACGRGSERKERHGAP